jgi:kynurenine aminotransferase
VFHKDELQKIADLAVKHQTIILSDEVYDRLFYVPFTRIANLSPEVEKLTLTVGSAGKNFYATGWRVGMFRACDRPWHFANILQVG